SGRRKEQEGRAHLLARSWYRWHHAANDSVHGAFHVCAPTRSTFARSRSSRADGAKGESALSHLGPPQGVGAAARCPQSSQPAVRRPPAWFLEAHLSSRKEARN